MSEMHLTCLILLDICFYAASRPDLEEQTKASDYLIDKWKKWHIALDVNHDGLLSSDDIKMLQQFYAGIYFHEDEQRNHIVATKERLLSTYLLGGRSEVSNDEFVEIMKTRYESNKDNFVDTLKEFDKEWFQLADLNRDNFLSKQECLIDMMSEGHTDTLKDEALFRSHEPVNELIPIDEAVAVFLRFQTEEDQSKTDIVNSAFESGF